MRINRIKCGIILGITSGILIITYLVLAFFFNSRFFIGSSVNCINIAGDTVEEVDKKLVDKYESYNLTIKEKDNKKEVINGKDIELSYKTNDEIKKLKKSQNPLKWIIGIFKKDNNTIEGSIEYNKDLLIEKLSKLECINDTNCTDSVNASIEYSEGEYRIIKEKVGTKIDRDKLQETIEKAISKGITTIDIEKEDCYVKPKYTSTSEKVIEAKDILNNYIKTSITYDFGETKETLDFGTTNVWFVWNDNFDVSVDSEKVRQYVKCLSSNYDTVGKTRNFTTSFGNTIQVSGGDYGSLIDVEGETESIISLLETGENHTRIPKYAKQTAINNTLDDIGDTYVEISITRQHLWFYKNGSLVTEGDVVTGNVSTSCGTPGGVYYLKYKQKDAVLKGEGYETNVTYWMPFNGGIGIHDAWWRGYFGGQEYMYNGSHGCVNAPTYLANIIFDNIEAGTPIVCYYE